MAPEFTVIERTASANACAAPPREAAVLLSLRRHGTIDRGGAAHRLHGRRDPPPGTSPNLPGGKNTVRSLRLANGWSRRAPCPRLPVI